MYNQLKENLTERETKFNPLTLVERLRDLNGDNKRTHVKCQAGVSLLGVSELDLTILIITGLLQFIICLYQNI